MNDVYSPVGRLKSPSGASSSKCDCVDAMHNQGCCESS